MNAFDFNMKLKIMHIFDRAVKAWIQHNTQ